mmetsp:Transcript_21276/g.30434  ORF Transcript_21276/g.30434 Transcript_21276/m.30434 type:complete len:97 (+) Transcript_21276:1122-1412(+)
MLDLHLIEIIIKMMMTLKLLRKEKLGLNFEGNGISYVPNGIKGCMLSTSQLLACGSDVDFGQVRYFSFLLLLKLDVVLTNAKVCTTYGTVRSDEQE